MTECDRITKKHDEQEVDAVVNAKAGDIMLGFLILFDDFDASAATTQDCIQE